MVDGLTVQLGEHYLPLAVLSGGIDSSRSRAKLACKLDGAPDVVHDFYFAKPDPKPACKTVALRLSYLFHFDTFLQLFSEALFFG
jgi:hypothetical protein